MGFLELLLLAFAVSMDAFAVAICKGLAVKKISLRHAVLVGAWFGVFQALMPVIGYLLGTAFERFITSIDHWIALALLILIGGNMIREACFGEEEEASASFGFRAMLPLAIATSIDALAVGVTFAFLEVSLLPSVTLIGVTTFLISALGVRLGNAVGKRYQKKAEIAGGVILILLGIKILLEHLGIWSF